jgi:hypothetical protein
MNRNTLEHLAELDAAPATELTAHERERSDALLRTVLASAPEPTVAPRRRGARGWIIGTAAALGVGVAAIAVIVVAPHLPIAQLGAPQAATTLTTAELASWTSDPTPLATSAGLGATERSRCLSSMSGGPGAASAGTITNADQRGDVASMIVNRGGYSILCITGSDGTGLWEVVGDPTVTQPQPAADGITLDSAGSHGQYASGFTYVEGLVGPKVTAISVHDAGKTFAATVENGRWTAWWPTPNPHGTVTGSITITTTGGATRTVSGQSLQQQ